MSDEEEYHYPCQHCGAVAEKEVRIELSYPAIGFECGSAFIFCSWECLLAYDLRAELEKLAKRSKKPPFSQFLEEFVKLWKE